MNIEDVSLTSFTKIFLETFKKHALMGKTAFAQTTQVLLQMTYGEQYAKVKRKIFRVQKGLQKTIQHLR